MDSAKLKRFGEVVKARRLELGLTQDEVTAVGGPSDKRQTKIENGAPPAPSLTTLAKVDRGLQWVSGSAARTVAGGEPTKLEDVPATPTQAVVADPDELDRHIRLAVAFERAGVTTIEQRGATRHTSEGTTFSPEVIDQLIDILNARPAARDKD